MRRLICWLGQPRYNYVDLVWMTLFSLAVSDGHWLAAFIALAVGAFVSGVLEAAHRLARETGAI